MTFEAALRHYRCYSHTLLCAMLSDQFYFDSLTENQQKGLYAAWEEFYYTNES